MSGSTAEGRRPPGSRAQHRQRLARARDIAAELAALRDGALRDLCRGHLAAHVDRARADERDAVRDELRAGDQLERLGQDVQVAGVGVKGEPLTFSKLQRCGGQTCS